MNLIDDIIFHNPDFFWFLLIPFIHLIWRFVIGKNETTSILFSNTSFLPKRKSIKKRLSFLPYLLQILSIIFIVIALARPQTTNSWEEHKTEGIDIIIAMDISGSMLATDIKPNRLTAAKNIAIDFIEERKNDRIGLVIFSGESFTQCPLTTDHNSLINLYKKVEYGMVDDGTAIGEGLGTAINRLEDSEAKSKIVILLTDGENTVNGEASPLTAANIAGSDSIGIKVYTICFGKETGKIWAEGKDVSGEAVNGWIDSFFDEETLKEIAKITGGEYFRSTNRKSLKEIYDKIDLLERTEIETKIFNTKNEEFYPLAFASLFSFLLSFLLKITYFRKI
jgi:Ca-activated chloride channel family protein